MTKSLVTKIKRIKVKMWTIESILNRSVDNWSKILGCSNEKTTAKLIKRKTTSNKKKE